MKTRIALLVVCMISASLLVSPCLAREFELREIPAGTEVNVIQLGDGPRPTGDECELHRLGEPAYIAGGWLHGSETYKIYCDPQGCPPHTSGYNGLVPTCFCLYLSWDPIDPGTCAVSFTLDMEHVCWIEPECPYPGDVIWTSGTYEFGPADPGMYLIYVGLYEAPCIAGPFFFSLYFDLLDEDCSGVDIVLFDTDPCAPCLDYNNWGGGWYDLCSVLGYHLAAYVQGVWDCDALEGWIDLDGDGACGPDEVVLEEVSDMLPVDVWLDTDCIAWTDCFGVICWDPSLEFADWAANPDLGCLDYAIDPMAGCIVISAYSCPIVHEPRRLGTIWLHNVMEETTDMIWIEALRLVRYGEEAWYGEGLEWCPGFETTSPVEGRTWGSIKAMYR